MKRCIIVFLTLMTLSVSIQSICAFAGTNNDYVRLREKKDLPTDNPKDEEAFSIYMLIQDNCITLFSEMDLYGQITVIDETSSSVMLTDYSDLANGYSFSIQDEDQGNLTIYVTVDGVTYWATI